MAITALTAPTVLVGAAWTGTAPGTASVPSGTITTSTDISTWLAEVSFEPDINVIDTTVAASAGYTQRVTGLITASVRFRCINDYAANALDQLFTSTISFGSTFYVDIKPTSSARGSTNPSYVAACLHTQWRPVTVTVGDVPAVDVTFPVTGRWARLVA